MVADVGGIGDVPDSVGVHAEVVEKAWLHVGVNAIKTTQGRNVAVGHLLPGEASLVELREGAEQGLELDGELGVAAGVAALGHLEPRFVARDEVEVAE